MAFIEMNEPGVNCGAEVAGDGGGLAAAEGTVADGAAVAVRDELACAMGARLAGAPAVERVPTLEETRVGAAPGAEETVPPQPSGRQLRAGVAAWPDQARNAPAVNAPIAAAAMAAAAVTTAARNQPRGAAGSGRCRPAVPLRRCPAAMAGAGGGVSCSKGGAGNHSDAPPPSTCAGASGSPEPM